jgi:excisionase family DNA binding protein
MPQQLLSAQQAAEILGLQVRTVREYVRQGRLPGVRIGKQYRIARADLEAFSGAAPEVGEVERESDGDGREGSLQKATPTVEASTVVHVANLAAESSARLERMLAAAAAAPFGKADPTPLLRVEPVYDAARSRLSIVIVGGGAQTAQLLRIIEAFAEG